MLHAAVAAAQSERDEMRLYINAAVQMEALRRAAGLPGAPVVSAAEAAGDLWLQVHRYEDARSAYVSAADRIGATPRILAGLARSAQRLDDIETACLSYRRLLDIWDSRLSTPAEIAEARQYVVRCGGSPP